MTYEHFLFYKGEGSAPSPDLYGTPEAVIWQAEKVVSRKWGTLTRGGLPSKEQIESWVADVVLRFCPYNGGAIMNYYRERRSLQ